MKKWIFRLIWIPVLLFVVLFMVANRQPVAISLDPFNADAPALTTPGIFLWVWLMLMLFTGLALGAIGMWVSARPTRVQARADKRTVKELRKDITRLETRLKEAEAGRVAPAIEPPLLESENA